MVIKMHIDATACGIKRWLMPATWAAMECQGSGTLLCCTLAYIMSTGMENSIEYHTTTVVQNRGSNIPKDDVCSSSVYLIMMTVN